MDLCSDIAEAKLALGNISGKYAKDYTYGNHTEATRTDMLRMQAYIWTMERNAGRNKALPINALKSLEGQKVEFSALKSQGNSLILDVKSYIHDSCVEYRPCLSDSEICQIVELARVLAYKYNC